MFRSTEPAASPVVSRPADLIEVFRSETPEYKSYLESFLRSTDEKFVIRQWLQQNLLPTLPEKGRVVDIGAASGELLPMLVDEFDETIVVEPNRGLAGQIRRDFPALSIHESPILETSLPLAGANLALLSHVRYYIAREQWAQNTKQLLSWVQPGGEFVEIMWTSKDSQDIIRQFLGNDFVIDLETHLDRFCRNRVDLSVSYEYRDSAIETTTLEEMVNIGVFLLNLVPAEVLEAHSKRPTRGQLADWVASDCKVDSGYRIEIPQVFARVKRESPV